MSPNKRSESSTENPKKLRRPQRTRQSNNASVDIYDICSDPPSADSCKADETLNAADSSKGIAKDGDTQPKRPSGGSGSVTVPPELNLEIFTLKYLQSRLQKTFLSKDETPRNEDMKVISGELYQLEDSPDLQSNAIRATEICKTLTEILKLKIPGASKFQFRSRFERLLERCNKALKLDTSSLSLKVTDNSQPKRKRNRDHIISNKRLRKTLTVVVIDSDDEISQDQSHQHESHQSDTPQHRTFQDATPRLPRTQRKSVIEKGKFNKRVDHDFKWMDNIKQLVKDAKELVEKLLPTLDKQEQQIIEQRVKMRELALQLNDTVDFLNSCGAQDELSTFSI